MLKPKKKQLTHYHFQTFTMHLRGTLPRTRINIYKNQTSKHIKHRANLLCMYLLSLSRTESSASEISSKRKKPSSFMARTRGPSCHSKSLDVSISSYNLEKKRVKLKGRWLLKTIHLLEWSVWEQGTDPHNRMLMKAPCRPVKIWR